MSNFLKAGAQWLHQTMAESAGETIIYRRCNDWDETEMVATIGDTEQPVENTDGVFIKSQWQDFVILKEEFLRFGNGKLYLPVNGDTIEWPGGAEDLGRWAISDSEKLIFAVRSPGDEPAWSWSDKFHTALRIHTQVTEDTLSDAAEDTL